MLRLIHATPFAHRILSSATRIKRARCIATLTKDSKTFQNLKAAFAVEAQDIRRYLHFAQKADNEGKSTVASAFRSTAEGQTGHANTLLAYIERVADPMTGMPIGNTAEALKSAIAGETQEFSELYPEYARIAREEGFEEIAEWFDTLVMSEKSHANRLTKAANELVINK